MKRQAKAAAATDQSATDKTKDYIIQALFALMKTMPFETITVTDVTKKAGIGRATYYRHFATKEDIIRYFFAQGMSGFEQRVRFSPRRKDDYYEMIFKVLSGMKEKQDAMAVIVSAHQEILYLDFLNESMLQTFRSEWPDHPEYAAYYTAGCLFNVSLQWIKRGCVESVKEMTDMYFSLLFPDEKQIFAG